MFPIYGCPDCGGELELDEEEQGQYYNCHACGESFDAHYIESPLGGGVVLQEGESLIDEEEDFTEDD